MNYKSPQKIINNYFGKEAVRLCNFLIKQRPQRADAIIFLQGDRLDRLSKAEELYKKGFAEKIIITGNNKLTGKGKRSEENDINLSKIKRRFTKHGIPESQIIIENKSMNTLGQAKNIIRLAKKKNWKILLVVTSSYHVLRAYLTFIKQTIRQGWRGNIIMQVSDLSWFLPPAGRRKTAIEMLAAEMEKIRHYQKNIATVKEGINYIKSYNKNGRFKTN